MTRSSRRARYCCSHFGSNYEEATRRGRNLMARPDQALANADSGAASLVATFSLRDLPDSFYDDPFPTYRALREPRSDPSHGRRLAVSDPPPRSRGDLQGSRALSFRQEGGVRAEIRRRPLLFQHHTTSLVFNDPPLHTRVRRLISGALNPRAIAGLEPALVALVDRLLDAMAGRGAVDLIEDFASAIPDRGDRQPARASRTPTAVRCAAGRSPFSARSSRC